MGNLFVETCFEDEIDVMNNNMTTKNKIAMNKYESHHINQ